MVECAEHTSSANGDRCRVEAACFATFEEQHGLAFFDCGLAKRTVPQPGIDHDWSAKDVREFKCWSMVDVASDLRQVGAEVRSGMEVDAQV